MKNQTIVLFFVCMVSILWLVGCEKSNPSDTEVTDQDAMTEIISNDAFFNLNDALSAGDPSTSQSSSLGKTTADIIPFYWGRKIASASRNITFTEITDATASAVVTHTWTGIVWIYGKYTLNDTSLSLVTKNITETVTRNVKLVRKNRLPDPRKNWKISEISVLAGGTVNGDLTIQKVEFYIGDDDTLTITDPLNYYFKIEKRDGRDGLRLVPPNLYQDFKIRVTLTSVDPDSDFVIAHRPVWVLNSGVYRHRLMTLVSSTPNNDNTYTRVYEHSWLGAWAGRHHVLVGAITRQSIFDDVAPFASQLWGIPYLVE